MTTTWADRQVACRPVLMNIHVFESTSPHIPRMQGVDALHTSVDIQNTVVYDRIRSYAGCIRAYAACMQAAYDRMQPACRLQQPAYDRNAGCMQAAYDRMQAAYDRMQPAYDRI